MPPPEFPFDKLVATNVDVLQGGYHMESPPSSERVAVVGGDNEQRPVRDGVRMDDQREHQRVCQEAHGYKSSRTCKFLASIAGLAYR